jgi:hypothetical protein
MTPDQIFSLANTTALVTWLALVLGQRRRLVVHMIAGRVVPALFALAYVVIVAAVFPRASGGFSSLSGVADLFSDRWLLLAGWLHYLAFDLLVGTWEAVDAHERGVHVLLVAPCLFVTFLFGPAGWLLYQIVRISAPVRAAAAPSL